MNIDLYFLSAVWIGFILWRDYRRAQAGVRWQHEQEDKRRREIQAYEDRQAETLKAQKEMFALGSELLEQTKAEASSEKSKGLTPSH